MHLRDQLKRTAIKTKNPEDWNNYKRQKNLVNKEVKRVKKTFYRNEIERNRGDFKGTWRVRNSLMNRKSNSTMINEIRISSSESLTNPKDIADSLNKYFIEVGHKLASEIPDPCNGKSFETYMLRSTSRFKLQKVKKSQVLKLLSTADSGKATGYDKKPNKLLKIAAPYICQSLTSLFNLSIETNIFPHELGIAKVSPLFKAGDHSDKENHRPISVIPTVARIFERIIYDQLYTYLIENELLNPQQSGFRSLHSTVTALLDLTNEWCYNIDRKMVNGVILLDLKKAFDTVNHDILLKKLEYFGFDCSSIAFFHPYLSNRKQQCNVNGFSSELGPNSCGVPQGTILGPLLFLIYINDLTNCLKHCTARLYADDTSLNTSGSRIKVIEPLMNADLKHVSSWLIANKLTLNVIKTVYMVVGSRQRLATLEGDINLQINSTSLKRVQDTKCLGVQIDENLTWERHAEYIIQKVACNIGILRKVSPILSLDNKIAIYRSIIEPYFCYCCLVWNGINETLSNKLQRLQNRAARVITGLPYSVRSKEIRKQLGWSSLLEMRKQQKAIMMYKIVNGLVPSYMADMFSSQYGSQVYNLRNSTLNFEIPNARTELYRNSFAFTGAKI